jgi:hypothetical protein
MNTDEETKENGKLPIFSVMLCLFYCVGFACGIALHEEHSKSYGFVLATIIAPALIYHAYLIVKWILNKA